MAQSCTHHTSSLPVPLAATGPKRADLVKCAGLPLSSAHSALSATRGRPLRRFPFAAGPRPQPRGPGGSRPRHNVARFRNITTRPGSLVKLKLRISLTSAKSWRNVTEKNTISGAGPATRSPLPRGPSWTPPGAEETVPSLMGSRGHVPLAGLDTFGRSKVERQRVAHDLRRNPVPRVPSVLKHAESYGLGGTHHRDRGGFPSHLPPASTRRRSSPLYHQHVAAAGSAWRRWACTAASGCLLWPRRRSAFAGPQRPQPRPGPGLPRCHIPERGAPRLCWPPGAGRWLQLAGRAPPHAGRCFHAPRLSPVHNQRTVESGLHRRLRRPRARLARWPPRPGRLAVSPDSQGYWAVAASGADLPMGTPKSTAPSSTTPRPAGGRDRRHPPAKATGSSRAMVAFSPSGMRTTTGRSAKPICRQA